MGAYDELLEDGITIGIDGKPTRIRYRQAGNIPPIDTKRKKKEAEKRRIKETLEILEVVKAPTYDKYKR